MSACRDAPKAKRIRINELCVIAGDGQRLHYVSATWARLGHCIRLWKNLICMTMKLSQGIK